MTVTQPSRPLVSFVGGIDSRVLTIQVAPNGRVFFINHTDKKTTWVDPRTGRPSALPNSGGAAGGGSLPNRPHVDDLGPLPEGWEERVHTGTFKKGALQVA